MADYITWLRGFVGHAPIQAAAAGVIIYRDGKVLLQKRNDDGTWCHHGGAVELGENVEDAARRELFEETGLVAGELTMFGVFSGKEFLSRYPNGDSVYYVEVTYICSDFSGNMITSNDETDQLEWFAIDDLPQNLHEPVDIILRKFIASVKGVVSGV